MEQERTLLERRLKRRALWVRLWLLRVLRFLSACAVDALPAPMCAWLFESLDQLARCALHLTLIRAARDYAPPRARAAKYAPAPHCPLLRAAVGGFVRRTLRAHSPLRARRRALNVHDIRARAHSILRAVEQLEILAARIARRLRKGLSRLASLASRVSALKPPPLVVVVMLAAVLRDDARAAAPP